MGIMSIKDTIEIVANLSAIVTAAIATLAFVGFQWRKRSRRMALEKYLKNERERDYDEGKRSVLHLMACLSMTESEVQQASFESKVIRTVPGIDDQGRADSIYFQYIVDDALLKRPF
jgi:hypothetical protein